jgi:superfamily II DNA or RNA helicase
MNLPDYVDNSTITLESVLQTLITQNNQLTLDIATGFFSIEAWIRLECTFNQLQSLRLLIGRDPTIRPAERDTLDLEKLFRKDIQLQLEKETFNQKYKQQIERMIEYLEQEHIQIRLFGVNTPKNHFLHAKAYIFDQYSIVGSSNFTPAGLQGNTELNTINKIEAIALDLRNNWFNKFWTDSSVDTEYKQKLIDTLNASKFGSNPYTPYQIFLKSLYELFKDESVIGEGDRTTLELASFQQQGFERAISLIERHRGCIVADAVGLGKTYIGLRVLDYYLIKLRRPGSVPRAMVICPAQLRDLIWLKKLDEFGLKADVLSQEEISRDNFEISKYRNHDIVIIDESHNFRNSATKRYQNLQKVLGSGKRNKRVLLLTATPINNSVFDLYHQISLLTRGQDIYYREYSISNLKTYFKDLNQGKVEITELLMQTIVRRSRQDVIRRQKAGEEIRIAGNIIKFPTRQLEQFTYDFENTFSGLYAGLANQIDLLNLAPYNIKAFKTRKQDEDKIEIKRNQALVALQKSLYLKRLESSILAFGNSIKRQLNFQQEFLKIFTEETKILDSKNFRKLILSYQTDGDGEQDIQEIIQYLDTVDTKEYQIPQLQNQIESDVTKLQNILITLETIENSVAKGKDYDRKLLAFKQLLLTLKGKKIIVFDYYQDTVKYVQQNLLNDPQWLTQMGNPIIETLTGDTHPKQRQEKVKRFAPKANCQDQAEIEKYSKNPIDILICTDVLSEGQNLQDSGHLINLSLHWNPVRMIQRAGRIDRLGTDYEYLTIYNCFPEEGLEELLNLVQRLQERIATIDREVGLDSSVLGETISNRSLEELYKLKQADTKAKQEAILEELAQTSDLVSLDEMRLPLLKFIQNRTQEEIENIPFGIHSTYKYNIPHPEFSEGGIFMAFKAKDKHFWLVYPRQNGNISTDSNLMITDKGKIFQWIKCRETDFLPPDQLKPAPFNYSIFPIVNSATHYLLQYFQKQQSSKQLKPRLTKVLNSIHHVLTDYSPLDTLIAIDSSDLSPIIQRITQVITERQLRIHEKDLKNFWTDYIKHKNLTQLVTQLDEYFIDNELYSDLESPEQPTPLELIQEQDIKLVCYQWFIP